jgi:hypothetical protein
MLVVRGQSGKKKERISSQPWARTMISAREGISFLEGGRIATENWWVLMRGASVDIFLSLKAGVDEKRLKTPQIRMSQLTCLEYRDFKRTLEIINFDGK